MDDNFIQFDMDKLNNLDEKPFFNLKFKLNQNHKKSESYICVESNYIDINSLSENCFKIFSDFFTYELVDNCIYVKLKQINQCLNFSSIIFDLNDLIFVNETNQLLYRSYDENTLDLFFDALSFSFTKIFDLTSKINSIIELKEYVNTLNEYKKKAQLKKFLSDNLLCAIENFNYNMVSDLDYRLLNLNSSDIVNIATEIRNLDIDDPILLLDDIILDFDPRNLDMMYLKYIVGQTLEEIGSQYGLTRERVRQIISNVKSMKLKMKVNSFYNSFYITNEFYLLFPYEKIDSEMLKKLISINSVNEKLLPFDFKKHMFYFNVDTKGIVEKIYDELPDEFFGEEVEEIYSEYYESLLPREEFICLLKSYFFVYPKYYSKKKIVPKRALRILIQKYYPDGIRIYDHDEILKLREYSVSIFGEDLLSENDRALAARIQDIAVLIDRGVWLVDGETTLPEELRFRINAYILNYEMPILPYETIFLAFKNELMQIGINNRYQLQSTIKNICDFKTTRDYVIKDSAYSFYDLVEDFVRNSNQVITKRVLNKKFPGITDATIQQVCNETGVVNMNGYFVHIDNLHIRPNEKSTLYNSVYNYMSDSKIYNSKAVFETIKKDNSGLFNRVGIMHYLQFFYLLREIFPNDFTYNRPFISKLGVEMKDADTQVLERLLEYDSISLEEIKSVTNDVGTIIDRYIDYIDKINDYFIFMDRNNIVKNQIAFGNEDFSKLDVVIFDFLSGKEYASLQQFYNYWELPTINIKWNDWVLYSIIKKFSKDYFVITSSKKMSDAIPYVYKKTFDPKEIIFDDEEVCDTTDFDFDDVDSIDELL